MTASDEPSVRQRNAANNKDASNANNVSKQQAVTATTTPSTAPDTKPLSVAKCLAPLPFVALHLYVLYTVFVWSEGKFDPFSTCSIAVPAIASAGYLALVFAGPRLMDALNLPTFELTEVMFVYNSYQTLLNGAIVGIFVWQIVSRGLPVWGVGVDRTPSGHWMAFGVWLHYHDKFIEYLDTLFMVLRRKNSQLSFLHWYHHILMGWAWFAVVSVACGGDAYFGAICNSFIHVVMYSYYALRAVRIPCPWKRQVTNLQMVQFVVCLSHSLYLLFRSDASTIYPPLLSFLELFVMVNMLVLFSNFYRQQYLKKKQAKKATTAATAAATAKPKAQ